MQDVSLPKRIQIQTTTACGAACQECPHPVEAPNWPNSLMDDELSSHVVDQLRSRDIEYLCPYLKADPLSDRCEYHVSRSVHEQRALEAAS